MSAEVNRRGRVTIRPPYRRSRVPAVVVVCVLLLAFGPADAAELARVQRVLDGDSVRLADGREVRLIGINAPEFGRNNLPDQPLAAAARDRAAGLMQGRTVRLAYDAERFDHHGRTLAYVLLPDGPDVQEVLLREGLAWFVAVAPNVARLNLYRAAESVARAAGVGVWGVAGYRPVPAAELTRRHTGFVRIVGTVQAVRQRRHGMEAQLTPDVRLYIPRGNDGLSRLPDFIVGQRVLARGWLTEYKNGLRLRITHPAMLESPP